MRAKVIGTGSALPPKVLTNQDLSKMVETSDQWIRSRTGISERRVTDEKTATSDLAFTAAKKAVASAKIDPSQLDLILVATCTPDMFFPSVGCILQDKLGAENAVAFDLSAACSGFNFALSTAANFIENGAYKNVLVVGADTLSKYLDWSDRSTCVLFGDGAGAVVLSAANEEVGILSSYLKAKGEGGKFLTLGGKSRFIKMDGKEVFKFAVKALEESIVGALKLAGLELSDLDLLIPHQANIRIIDHVIKKFGLLKEKVFVNLEKYGNTSAASIPIALDEALQQGKIKAGEVVVLAGFGAGLTYGANVVKW